MNMNDGKSSPGFRPQSRQRGFSFKSDKSSGSKPKEHLAYSPDEKRRHDSIWKNSSKANPNAAMTEAQPGGSCLFSLCVLCFYTYYQNIVLTFLSK
jgi:hypothetical protein